MALGVMAAARSLGLRVPEDLSSWGSMITTCRSAWDLRRSPSPCEHWVSWLRCSWPGSWRTTRRIARPSAWSCQRCWSCASRRLRPRDRGIIRPEEGRAPDLTRAVELAGLDADGARCCDRWSRRALQESLSLAWLLHADGHCWARVLAQCCAEGRGSGPIPHTRRQLHDPISPITMAGGSRRRLQPRPGSQRLWLRWTRPPRGPRQQPTPAPPTSYGDLSGKEVGIYASIRALRPRCTRRP